MIFYQTECTEGVMALTSMSSSETPLTALLIYIVDDDGNFDDYLTKLLPNLYKVSMPTIDFPLRVSQQQQEKNELQKPINISEQTKKKKPHQFYKL